MDIQYHDKEGVTVVAPTGNRIDSVSARDFKETFSTILENSCPYVVLDLGNVDFIDSTGMTALVSMLRLLQGKQCPLAIYGMRPTVVNLFRITKLDRVFRIVESETQAIEAVKS